MTRLGSARWLPIVVFALASVVGPTRVEAQSFQGSTLSSLGGLFLGGFSGGTLGLIGSMMPCNRTLAGGSCAASGAGTGAAIGLAMGGLIGAQNQEDIIDRAENAAIGVGVGAIMGVVLRRAVRQYQWGDALATAVVGGAIGAAPLGAGVGAAAGLTVGGLVWALRPSSGAADAAMLVLVGMAAGSMVDWAKGAAEANRRRDPSVGASFSISVR